MSSESKLSKKSADKLISIEISTNITWHPHPQSHPYLIRLTACGGEESDEGDDHVLVSKPHCLRNRTLMVMVMMVTMVMMVMMVKLMVMIIMSWLPIRTASVIALRWSSWCWRWLWWLTILIFCHDAWIDPCKEVRTEREGGHLWI